MRPNTNPVTAYVAIGSNIGDRYAHVEAAVNALGDLACTRVVALSSLHDTAPVGPAGQDRYLNAAVGLETSLAARRLLEGLLDIERSRGRVRADGVRWGPRTLDLDMVLYGNSMIDEPDLIVPHPRMHERMFVLAPLVEIAGPVVHPRLGVTIAQLYERARAKELP